MRIVLSPRYLHNWPTAHSLRYERVVDFLFSDYKRRGRSTPRWQWFGFSKRSPANPTTNILLNPVLQSSKQLLSLAAGGDMSKRYLIFGIVLALFACTDQSVEETQPAMSIASDSRSEWLSYGRTYKEQRFSPLTQINQENIDELGLAWSYDTGQYRGHEATPLVSDGVMYLTSSWAIVHALDARTGEELWVTDPGTQREFGRMVCCDVVNRGAALWGDSVYVGTVHGHLVRMNKKTGEIIWSVDTRENNIHYTITGAPRIVADKVIIGNGGAELGARGYVSAYDADSGKLLWRFWTVPGNPAEPIEHPALAAALPTWTGEWWKYGGGGTVWDSLAYDPELNLLYVGTGNGAPWSRALRSPGGGDNLYLSSIVALDPDTGDLVWYYQTTPGDNWDYTATQHMILADIELDGTVRQVIMQAPKNGFFYVLDRKTGEFLSAEKFSLVTWASHIDADTGRPVEVPEGVYDSTGGTAVFPGPLGGHNWHPMAYNPNLRHVYIPKSDRVGIYTVERSYRPETGVNNSGNRLPIDEFVAAQKQAPAIKDYLLAWDPVTQSPIWEIDQVTTPNGGVLATASNLVFQGTGDGYFKAYAGEDGKILKEISVEIGIMAPPITYELDGEQYVAVVAGSGGAGIRQPEPLRHKQNTGRVFAFKLGAAIPIPSVPDKIVPDVTPPASFGTPAQVSEGKALYHRYCSRCHGANGSSNGIIRDLRYATPVIHENWNNIVLEGMFEGLGMAAFNDVLNETQAQAIRSYVVSVANSTESTLVNQDH